MVPDHKPGGDWRILVPIGLAALLACGGLFWALWPEQPYLTGDAGYEEQDLGYYPGGTACYPSEVSRLPWRERVEQSERCQDAQEQHRLAANDLMQQRRAANAAEATAVLAYDQTRIAIWALIFAVCTLAAALLAAIYARMAAIAARTAVVATREIADSEHRPWLTFSDVGIGGAIAAAVVVGGPIVFQVKGKITNSGSIAANHVRVRVVICKETEIYENYQGILGGEIIGSWVPVTEPMVMGPNSGEPFDASILIEVDMNAADQLPEMAIYFYLVAEYTSIATTSADGGEDREHRTTQIYRVVNANNPSAIPDWNSIIAGTFPYGVRQSGGRAS